MAGLPHLAVVACGGTIASTHLEGQPLATPNLAADDLVAAVPQLRSVAALSASTFSVKPSSQMRIDDVLPLRHHLLRLFREDPELVGAVVTHGTDTLEEVAYALDLMWSPEAPVVFTGAMRNATLAGPDGPANILAAAVTALAEESRSLGVLVVANDEIHAARYVRKTHTTNVSAFASPGAGPLGVVAEGTPRIAFVPRRRRTLRTVPDEVDGSTVALLTQSIGDDGRLFGVLAPLGYRGVVIEGLGGGHVTPDVASMAGFNELLRIVPVVLTARTGAGATLAATYRFAGSETDLAERGVISGGSLDGPKARVLLTLLLASGADRGAICESFAFHGL